MDKRSNFYPNGEMIDFRLPQDFRPSTGRGSCGNCGQYSNKRSFCNIYKSFGVKDIFVVFGELEEFEILMYATNGDNDTSRDR